MVVLICDDEEKTAQKHELLCRAYFEQKKIKAIVECVEPEDVLARSMADIIILDVDMPSLSGLEIKERLSYKHTNSLIIFITNYPQVMPEAFGRNVIGFLTKPVDREKLYVLIEKAVNMVSYNKEIEIDNEKIVMSDEIFCVMFEYSYSYVITQTGKHICRRTLKEWEKLLPCGMFVRVNNSCIFNCAYIKSINNEKIKTKLDEIPSIKISRRRRKKCEETYLMYCKKMSKYV